MTCSSIVTSVGTTKACCPSSRISFARDSNSRWVRAARLICAPSPANASAIAFPVGQQINEADGAFDLETITAIREKFETNFLGDEPIYCVISPAAKKSLIDSSNSTLNSTDFVDSTSYFMEGKLPDVYGVHMIVHPLVTSFSGSYDDAFFAWCPQAIIYNQFDALQTKMDEVAAQKFNTVLQVREYIGACRVDDLGVVQGTLGTP